MFLKKIITICLSALSLSSHAEEKLLVHINKVTVLHSDIESSKENSATESYEDSKPFIAAKDTNIRIGSDVLKISKGMVLWSNAISKDYKTIWLKDPQNPKGPSIGLSTSSFEKFFKTHQPAFKLKKDILTDDGIKIKAGTVIAQETLDKSNVKIFIEGDRSQSAHRIPKSYFSNEDYVQDLQRPGKLESTRQTYKSLKPFKNLPSAQSESKPASLSPGTELEVIDEAPGGAYSWAKKIKIKSGSHQGRELYLSKSFFSDSEALEEQRYENQATSNFLEMPDENHVKENSSPTPTHSKKQSEFDSKNHQFSVQINGVFIDTLKDPSMCSEKRGHKDRPPMSVEKRKIFKQFLISAANEYGVDPATLEASIHLETDLNAFIENGPEKKAAIKKYGSAEKAEQALDKTKANVWGKGLCQFGPAAAQSHDLNWLAPKPSKIPVSPEYKQKYPNSVWDPAACIMAKASYMRRYMDREDLFITLKDGTRYDLKPYLFERGPENAARAFLSFFNRGTRLINSIQAYYSKHGKLPKEYGQAWSEPLCSSSQCQPRQPAKTLVLRGQEYNRNHILNGVGLCGKSTSDSLYGSYSREYSRDSNGRYKSL